MTQTNQIKLNTEADTIQLGYTLAGLCPSQLITFYLEGELGAGKTTLTRGFLKALGHTGNVKSPTYTLVEQYELVQRPVYHFDLYRLADPEELEFIGLDQYMFGNAVLMFEWAINGSGYLPSPDLIIRLDYEGNARLATLKGESTLGNKICEQLQ